jgi:hemoglobin-like flavoprotein
MPSTPGSRELRRIPVDPQASIRLGASLDLLRARGAGISEAFYARLFTRFPGIRGMFPADMTSQHTKFLDTLTTVVEMIGQPETVRARLEELGKKHAGYGARPEHYSPLCEALIESLREAAGSAWSAQLEAEWTQALQLVSEVMLRGAGHATRTGEAAMPSRVPTRRG